MGIGFLVRHAQASFLEPNYDKLSKLGEAQACLLGEYWARHKILFDRACSGPCVRQKDTLALVSDACRKAGIRFPDPPVVREFDEYQGEAVLERSLPGLLETDQTIRSRSEEHTSELQSLTNLVCRLLLAKKQTV